MSVERALEGALEKVEMTTTTTTRYGPTPTTTTTTVPTVSVHVLMSTARALECECTRAQVQKACSGYKVLTEFHVDALPHLMGKLGVLVDTSSWEAIKAAAGHVGTVGPRLRQRVSTTSESATSAPSVPLDPLENLDSVDSVEPLLNGDEDTQNGPMHRSH
jgi:hypothetical protein